MNSLTVRDVMVPLVEYATVSKDATMLEAVLALEKAQEEFDQTCVWHRAILVFDENRKVVGKLSQLDILRALEPKYEQIGMPRFTAYNRFTQKFIRSLFQKFNLWNKPLEVICEIASKKSVKDFMYGPDEDECVDEKTSLNEAIHQLVIGQHQSLLVVRGKEIIGILRLNDVFTHVSNLIKACGPADK